MDRLTELNEKGGWLMKLPKYICFRVKPDKLTNIVLEKVPSENIEEIVRCKDCVHYRESDCLSPNKFCFRLKGKDGNPIGYNFAPDDYCSRGERVVAKSATTDERENK